ncbi:MAG: hypothetical protein AAGU76_08295 [Sedimentibacter sp.]
MEITMKPIGYIRTPYKDDADMPRQPVTTTMYSAPLKCWMNTWKESRI